MQVMRARTNKQMELIIFFYTNGMSAAQPYLTRNRHKF
ncbi:hypothetical protein Q7O_002789 [Pectobacterium carotovorum subsp. carotovorum PCCS1]|nr:hypothetical protein [Pectobacterium carotovorum subsp. carotovorum PCCS1]